jgi:hypothetical protein
MRASWIAAPILLAATPAFAGMMFGLGKAPGGSGYTPLCNIVVCTYAFSTERQLVGSATVAFQVFRTADSTTQDVGFTAAGAVNTATVDAFCNASVSGAISRNCFISKVYDQSGNGCVIYNSTPSAMPDYMVSPIHKGLPIFQKTFQGSTSNLNFLLDNNGGSTGSLTAPCSLLTGSAQSLFFSGNSAYGSNIGGQANLQENVPGVITGTMFGAYVGLAGLTYGYCTNSPPAVCIGLDTEGEGPQANYTPAASNDLIMVAATAGGTGPNNFWANNTQILVNGTISTPLVTQARMSWGTTGDHTSNGPAIVRSETFYTVDLNGTQAAALYSNEAAFDATLSTGYQGPGDLFAETSATSGLSTGHVTQLQWLSVGLSLRKAYAGYEGPALNVCQGQGAVSCKDIGFVGTAIDTATMSAFCGPISSLNNCAVQIWYNQALNQNSTANSVNTALDATAASTTKRPTILWSGCQTTVITVCIATSPTNYFTTNGIGVSSGGYTLSAVAQRISTTTNNAIYSSSSGTGPETFLGFAAAANECYGAAHNGGGGATLSSGCAENTVHSITVDAATSPSASTVLYSDGFASTPVTSTVGYSTSGLGVGATGAGAFPCTCQLSEVLIYGDTHDATFATALGASNVAILRANQRAAFGF